MKILVAEDNQRMRQLICLLLRSAFFDVVECENGQETLDAIPTHQPDWVVMDIEMPQLDGISALRRLHAQFPSIRSIMLTSHDTPALRSTAKQAGATAYFLKENLAEMLRFLHSSSLKN